MNTIAATAVLLIVHPSPIDVAAATTTAVPLITQRPPFDVAADEISGSHIG